MKPLFESFQKIPRLFRNCVITEKIDGTNGQIYIDDAGEMWVGSRNRWLSSDSDNFGFYNWAMQNKEELMKLGPGRHYGEWWGLGIQRGYGLKEKRFSLFDVHKWKENRPSCCHVVPILYEGLFYPGVTDEVLDGLGVTGSAAAPGFNAPEGIVVYHTAARVLFKVTLENDEVPKTIAQAEAVNG